MKYAISFGCVGSEMSHTCTPALKAASTMISGFAVPGAIHDPVLCVPKRPRDRQKSVYGASFGGTARGNRPIMRGFFRSLTSTTCTGLYGSRQSGSTVSGEQISRFFSFGLPGCTGKIVWNGMPPIVSKPGRYWLMTCGFAGFDRSIVSMPKWPKPQNAILPPSSMRFGMMPPCELVHDERSPANQYFLYSVSSLYSCPGTCQRLTSLTFAGSVMSSLSL